MQWPRRSFHPETNFCKSGIKLVIRENFQRKAAKGAEVRKARSMKRKDMRIVVMINFYDSRNLNLTTLRPLAFFAALR